MKLSVSPGCVTRLHTYIFLAFDASISERTSSTIRFGVILVNSDPAEKIIKSACLIALNTSFDTENDNQTFNLYRQNDYFFRYLDDKNVKDKLKELLIKNSNAENLEKMYVWWSPWV